METLDSLEQLAFQDQQDPLEIQYGEPCITSDAFLLLHILFHCREIQGQLASQGHLACLERGVIEGIEVILVMMDNLEQ